MGASFKQALVGAAALAGAAQVAGAGSWVGAAVDSFTNDPNVGPGWLTSRNAAQNAPTVANTPSDKGLAMALNSGIKPVTTAVDFTKP